MSVSGDEMMVKLASLLGPTTDKTAAKKDDNEKEDKEKDKSEDKKDKKDEKCCKCGKKDCKCGCKGDPDKCKCDAKKKKAELVAGVMNDLVKLASELDDLGAEKASDLVDVALRQVVAAFEDNDELGEDDTEMFEEDESVTGREEGMGSRTEHTLQEPLGRTSLDVEQPGQEYTPEGLGMEDFNEHGTHEDKLDQLFQDPEFRAKVKELLG